MNRRQLLRTAVGVGATAASLPVLSKLVEANDRVYAGNAMCAPSNAPEWKEPPLDLRTPEQVVIDAETEHVNGIVRDMTADYTKYHKFVYNVEPEIFESVRKRLTETNQPFELRFIDPKQCLIVNGNVMAAKPITYLYNPVNKA